jgi:NADH:ubiquinone oxidoreductase subunit F (NADH-binding)
MKGTGVFICDEREITLIALVEGKRVMPLLKSPFSAQNLLW